MSPRIDLGPKPGLGYTANPLDRVSERRTDSTFLAAIASENRARLYLIAGESVILKNRGDTFDPLFTRTEADAFGALEPTIFLGLAEGTGRFAAGLSASTIETFRDDDQFLIKDLRSIATQGLVGPDHLAAIAEGKALLHWHARHQFCANCGAPSRPVHGGWRRDCAKCEVEHFPRTDPVVIMLASHGERCLLGRQARFAPGMWSCLAGFVEPGETIEDAVRRETREEAGISCGRVKYFASQPWPFPMSLMIGAHVEALSADIVIDRTELEDARWFEREEVIAMFLREHPDGLTTPPPIAIAHHIIRAWLEDGDYGFD
ncbi:MAG TPA: NAD(+) diphosphatase [Xanthobacteraceae bacterium]|jgi:NAD+ diphosphatase|nr:NAD(+) diphosphatase [Xanthobacteraceae bacterium]